MGEKLSIKWSQCLLAFHKCLAHVSSLLLSSQECSEFITVFFIPTTGVKTVVVAGRPPGLAGTGRVWFPAGSHWILLPVVQGQVPACPQAFPHTHWDNLVLE